jgi:hypothetical protein
LKQESKQAKATLETFLEAAGVTARRQ